MGKRFVHGNDEGCKMLTRIVWVDMTMMIGLEKVVQGEKVG
jgi:hypothetical protein